MEACGHDLKKKQHGLMAQPNLLTPDCTLRSAACIICPCHYILAYILDGLVPSV